eukprot:CAMPEP_0197681928 /NCGR_PEP_ID=MMETSP1338-20131121/95698_1 /TAXON_ID=43686 ORGANISM="Pelagodinium beii, Strain RCC1491" /NCGR_SAMPLE_ID=MMETSP1338 /ASSEMBLY_ACC=CAM_ASM_000754 /LENGTH=43 /DNA_ID= /DNA_START= /DNA_END= /DNA_ORIENTATION=
MTGLPVGRTPPNGIGRVVRRFGMGSCCRSSTAPGNMGPVSIGI